MIYTLQRYIFRELFRIFVMATVGLTLILSLGMVLKPAQEYGVGPRQVLHLLVYFMPVTLTFVLPMAALFASTLTYGRFAGDNELNACRASGIGLWTYVYPGLALSLLVATANLLLSFHVMPYFVHLAEQSLNADVKQVLFRNLQRRGFYETPSFGNGKGRFRIYADDVDPDRNTLYGAIVVQASREGIGQMWTAEQATVTFEERDNLNEVTLSIYKGHTFPFGEGMAVRMIGQGLVRSTFSSLLGDEIKFKKIDEMKQIRENPMLFEPIAASVRSIYGEVVKELVASDISRVLGSGGPKSYELRGPAHSVRISASSCELKKKEQAITLIAPVLVEEYDLQSGRLVKRLRSKSEVFLYVGSEVPNPRLVLELPEATSEMDQTVATRHTVDDLDLPEAVARKLSQRSLLQITQNLKQVLGQAPPSSSLDKGQKDLLRDINDMFADIRGEMNSRLVFGIGCIPMILIGIGLGIINRGGHLLSAFGASCAPAAVLIIGVVSGRQVIGNAGAREISGVAIMWGGLTLLVFVTVFIYRKLMRT
jgi:lipopolysaccharide export LptBFGC system permease protein LptF